MENQQPMKRDPKESKIITGTVLIMFVSIFLVFLLQGFNTLDALTVSSVLTLVGRVIIRS